MSNPSASYVDFSPGVAELRREALQGLKCRQKKFSPKFLYDEEGSKLFEQICLVEAYYVTRAEKEILRTHGREISSLIGPGAVVIEPGAGAAEKVGYILEHLERPEAYVPVEISKEILLASAGDLGKKYPGVPVMPICADYTTHLELPVFLRRHSNRTIFFPGSTIGNLDPEEAHSFLRSLQALAGPAGSLVIGVDTKKDRSIFELAYDDPEGVTAAFNLNLLVRLNRELEANFDLEQFFHCAIYNEEKSRVEMHLVSRRDQIVRVAGAVFRFREGETIHTESSYKYAPEEFVALAASAGFSLEKKWSDANGLFAEYFFRAGCGKLRLT